MILLKEMVCYDIIQLIQQQYPEAIANYLETPENVQYLSKRVNIPCCNYNSLIHSIIVDICNMMLSAQNLRIIIRN